jgi:hypothetical protein
MMRNRVARKCTQPGCGARLTSAALSRSVVLMAEQSRSVKRSPLAAVSAMLAIFSLVIAPSCGSLCSALSHCPAQAARAQTGSDDCHHSATWGNPDDPGSLVHSAKNCARPEMPSISLEPTTSWSDSRSDRGSHRSVSLTLAPRVPVLLVSLSRRPRLDNSDISASRSPLTRSSVLQI